MERHKKNKKQGKKVPRVPIKTYKWEDVRRSRKKGGYPWTYLYKHPFKEELDPEEFTMEAMRKSKSASTLGKTDSIQIEEILSSGDSRSCMTDDTQDDHNVIIITEEIDDSNNHSKPKRAGSFVIQEEEEETVKKSEEPEFLNLESAESSDNISQYLDKEERLPEKATTSSENAETNTEKNQNLPTTSGDDGKKERAKSEEPPKKRKLSIDSSRSRMSSISRLGIVKKFKEAKEKIKFPKFTLSTPNLFKIFSKNENENKENKLKKDNEELEKKKEEDESKKVKQTNKKSGKPVYIHIPLKPPPGQTDEFSYLEFEEKKKPEDKTETPKTQEETKIETNENENENEKKPVELSPIPKNELLQPRPSIDNSNEIVAIEIVKSETINLDDNRKDSEDIDEHEHLDNDIFIIEPGPGNETNEDVIIILSDSDKPPKLSRTASKKLALSLRKRRAKSAEPERKRKSSIESGNSRISLPKGGLLKRLKDAKDKFRFPKFNLTKSDSQKSKKSEKSDDKKQDATETKKEDKNEKKKDDTTKKIDKPKGDEPKYIHIPLKPPPGQTDEFSHLEFESKESTKPETIREDSKEDQTSPVESPVQNEDVQFIFLTPPSDDEILDKSPDIPETPSSESSSFFEHRVEDLKELAKGAVDKISPEAKKKKLEPVTEENMSDKVKIEETEEEIPETLDIKECEESKLEEQEERMIVDEEDGLKLSESAIAKQEQLSKSKTDKKDDGQELKSSLKGEGSPILKKKVSFKKKTKPTNTKKDGSYEDIQVPTEEKPDESDKENKPSKLPVLGTSQSMSVDEEKTYLDDKIIKSASLEEDYNKWSKLSDHEYEPINPPPDEKSTSLMSPPTVRVTDTDLESRQNPISSPISLVQNIKDGKHDENNYPQEETYVAQHLQTEMEDKYFITPSNPSADTTLKTSDISSSISDNSDKKKSKNTDEKQNESPGKFQRAIKAQAGKFKDKIHSLKKPNIKLPNRPKISRPTMQKFKIEKPKFHLPKIPDTTRINLPSFSLPRKSKTTTTTTTTKTTKRTLKERQLSTESNAGDSKKKLFDFSTYPRIFKKKPKNDFDDIKTEQETKIEFATVPRTKSKKEDSGKSKETDQWEDRDNIRIPLHAEDAIDPDIIDTIDQRIASHIGYDDDIDNDDAAFEKENQEIHRVSPFSNDYNSRWNHGNFHPEPNQEEFNLNIKNREYKVTDLDSPEDGPTTQDSFDTNTSKDNHSSESSLGIHRRGVLEEIDSDEFFLRQKGISQDNIEVGMYLSSEIREAFKQPINSLLQMQDDQEKLDYIDKASTESIPEVQSKRKSNKKPKRKKTPHVSQEQIPDYDQDDSETEQYSMGSLPPPRPKRRSKKSKKTQEQQFIPYRETIPMHENLGILNPSEGEQEREYRLMYENQQMEGKEQPEINIIDPYKNIKYEQEYDSDEEDIDNELNEEPLPPPRKHRSLKSLSEPNSESNDYNFDRRRPLSDEHIDQEYIIPTPEGPPSKPPRGRDSLQSLDRQEFKSTNQEVPKRPMRSNSRTRSESCGPSITDDDQISRDEDLLISENQEPCVEEPCQKLICDYMGYAVVDKSKIRDPPLPPPRPAPRQRRSVSSAQSSTSELRFSTVPRSSSDKNPPVRPLRNYSTLGPSRPPRRKQAPNMTDEEKENIDITQYIEIEGEPNRDLNSGDIIQKMRDRPLPAPPRPPRKTRTLQDITTEDNITLDSSKDDIDKSHVFDETEVSTQTEPLPDDFVCEEVVQEPSDKILAPSPQRKNEQNTTPTVERHLITPTHYTHEETITHGTLLVQPLNGAKILPDSEFTRIEKQNERIIPVERDFDDDETSEIPEHFKKLKNPEPAQTPQVIERIIERPVAVTVDSNTEVDVLKAQKLQVSDLDVDKLTVNELLAHKIIVSEIDSSNIQTNEIGSKSGTLKIGEIELPPSIIQQIIEQINTNPPVQSPVTEQREPKSESSTLKEVEENADSGQKKTPIEQNNLENETLPQRPPRKTNENLVVVETELEIKENIEIENEQSPKIQTDSLNKLENEEIHTTEISISQQQITSQPPDPPKRLDSSTKSDEMKKIEQELIQQLAEEASLPPQRPPRQSREEQVTDELEVDDEPPPRPPQPRIDYIPSQPPASFYALRAQKYAENLDENTPTVPRRKRHHRPPISRSSSEDNNPVVLPSRRRYRSPEPTIPELTSQLILACGSATNNSIRRLISHITNNVLHNQDGNQDLHVMIIILLILIAGLILLGYGEEKTVHYHHWEYFNPPRDM